MIISNQEELAKVAADLLQKHADERVFGFFGEMGAGKTTLIKEICRQLGVTATTSSPTFAIVNEYFTEEGEPVYHFDFYRINSIDEAVKIGFDDYLYSGAYCFIEWTEKVEELMTEDDYVRVDIKVLDDGKREFKY
jgi:tRNA threonylcarbamoyladenosine biosynthesis protein TsaE